MSEEVYQKTQIFQVFSALFYIGINANVPQLQVRIILQVFLH